jgi:hypothetical protein
MPQCSDCHCDLPGFETLCSKCLEARYSELGHPKSVLESMRLFVSNPFGITLESKSKMGRRGAIACSCGGVLLCWLGRFAKVTYKSRSSRTRSFMGHSNCLVKSASLSLGLSLFLARKNLRLYWEVALGGFLAISLCYAHSNGHVGGFPAVDYLLPLIGVTLALMRFLGLHRQP